MSFKHLPGSIFKISYAHKALPLFLGLFLLMGCTSTQTEPDQRWYKGNLHTHSYWSDGDEFPEIIMDWYKSHGYQFVALSDHNTLAEGERWKLISEDSVYQAAFRNYLEEYGSDWVVHEETPEGIRVKLKTFEEYKTLFEEEGEFLVIQSEEISDSFEGKPLHMNATNVQSEIEPQGGNSVVDVLQRNINKVLQQREETGKPIMPHINHPNFYYAITVEQMAALEGERFFEVYNGHHMVQNSGDEEHISTEEMWDLINIAYLEAGKPLIYGLATDDSHNYHHHGEEFSNAGRGWIMVRADSLNPASIITAMEAGDFYSSTGVTLSKLSHENNVLSIEVDAEPDVTYSISFIGAREGEPDSEVFETVETTSAGFEITKDMQFVRAKITSSKLHPNPIEDIIYEMAWTQPVIPSY